MKHIIFWFAIIFCAGLVFAKLFRINSWLYLGLGLVFSIACILLIRKELGFNLSLVCLVFTFGSLTYENCCKLRQDHILQYVYYQNNTLYLVKGFIKSYPQNKDNFSKFIFAAEEIEFNNERYRCKGNILVRIQDCNDLVYGESLILLGALRKPYYNQSNDIVCVMNLKFPSDVKRIGDNKGSLIIGISLKLKRIIEKTIYRYLSPLSAGIVDAMVLGEKKNIPQAIYDSMVKTGTVHILVVSGFNVGVVAFIVMLFFKILHIPRGMRYVLSIICLVFYCFITGASTPVIRATIMSVFFILGFLIVRESDIYNSFGLASLVILVLNPKELFSVSFQLSFASVLSIICIYPRLKTFFKLENLKIKFLRAIFEGCLVSMSAWLGVFSLIICYFKIFSPITILANILIVPLAALITISGFSLVIASLTIPPIAWIFASANEFWVVLLLNINALLLRLPYAYLYV